MALYAKPVRLLMRDMVEDFELQVGQTFTKEQVSAWFRQKYPRVKPGTISAHLIRLSTNAPSRLHHPIKPDEDDLFFQLGNGNYRLYSRDSDPKPIYQTSRVPGSTDPIVDTPEETDDDAPVTSAEFAYEADLKNYLSRNLHILEVGLSLYEDDGINGIEFPVGGRFVDILAVDKDGDLVVIELKVSRGYDRVVGQLMRYMAWISSNQADEGQQVRGMIVARQISTDLQLACRLVPSISLYEYELSLSISSVETA